MKHNINKITIMKKKLVARKNRRYTFELRRDEGSLSVLELASLVWFPKL
jgi:hypothetical protein